MTRRPKIPEPRLPLALGRVPASELVIKETPLPGTYVIVTTKVIDHRLRPYATFRMHDASGKILNLAEFATAAAALHQHDLRVATLCAGALPLAICAGCEALLDDRPWAPMLRDDVWLKLADEDEVLCTECFFALARERLGHRELAEVICAGCEALLGHDAGPSLPPRLRADVWLRLADKGNYLCTECLDARSRKRRVPLTLADLRPCRFNLSHRPHSWFDFFAKGATQADIDAWLAEASDERR